MRDIPKFDSREPALIDEAARYDCKRPSENIRTFLSANNLPLVER